MQMVWPLLHLGTFTVSDHSRLNITDAEGWIVSNRANGASIPGIFCSGRCFVKTLRLAAVAGDGRDKANHMVYSYVEEVQEKLAK